MKTQYPQTQKLIRKILREIYKLDTSNYVNEIYNYAGNCVTGLDDLYFQKRICSDATEMSRIVDEDHNTFLNAKDFSKHVNWPTTTLGTISDVTYEFAYNIDKDVYWAYHIDDDIHFFFVKDSLGEIIKPADPATIDPEELKMGTKVEMEHTDNPKKARYIALQHLAEDPKYYTKLKSLNLEQVRYRKPNFEFEWEEAMRYPEFKEMGKEKWIEIAKKGKSVKFSSIKNKLGNVDLNFDSLEKPKKNRFSKAFQNNKIEIPIAVKFANNDYDLISGNTRLSGLVKNGIDPKIWIVDISKQSTNDMSLNTEDLRKWLGKGKEGGVGGGGWDRYNFSGERVGKCGDAKEGEPYSACLSRGKAEKLGKKGIASFVRRKRDAQKKAGDAKKGGERKKGQKPTYVKTGA